MPAHVVDGIVFLEGGSEGLRIAAGDRNLLLPLRRGAEVSFSLTPPSRLTRRAEPCAICDGSRCLKGLPDCGVPHALYVALFGSITKVGVTKEGRFPRRMREQGAEFAGVVKVLGDGMEARRAESEMASMEGLRDRVAFEDKVKSVGLVGDLGQAHAVLDQITALPSGIELSDIRGMYQNPQLGSGTRPIVINGDSVRGIVADTRGEVLYVERRGNLYAFDLRRTLGRGLRSPHGGIETQLTLQNFGDDEKC